MATLTQQQKQQVNNTLSSITQTLQNISKGLSTLTPSQAQQLAPQISNAVSKANTVLGSLTSTSAGTQQPSSSTLRTLNTSSTKTSTTQPSTSSNEQYYWVPSKGAWLSSAGLANAGYPSDAIPVSDFGVMPSNTQPLITNQPSPNSLPDYSSAYQQLLNQYNALLQKYSTPPTVDTSQVTSTYNQAISGLKQRYQKALADLQKKQAEDAQRLVGRYAAAGFSEPGIQGGPVAGIPGITTKALNDLQSQQVSDVATLQQAESSDVNSLAVASLQAQQQAQQQAIDNYYKQLQLLQNALAGQSSLVSGLQPSQISIGSRIYQRDPLTGALTNITPPEVEASIQQEERAKGISTPFVDSQGGVYVFDVNSQQLKKVGQTAPTSTTSSNNTGSAVSPESQAALTLFIGVARGKIQDLINTLNLKGNSVTQYAPYTIGLLPGTDAWKFRTDLEGLKSTLRTTMLTVLRSLSKSGASGFGQLSNAEGQALENALANLNPGLTADQLKIRLQELNNVLDRTYGLIINAVNAGVISPNEIAQIYNQASSNATQQRSDNKFLTPDEIDKAIFGK